MSEKKKETFQEKLSRLEEIVEKVENEALSLEESLKYYDEGMAIIKECQKTLNEAKTKIIKVDDNK